ncbi:MAG TPA: fumarylacetoacetate hydrolase family protein [Ramlibacter sp.]|nr:fumarylacetoacetate hydrolase family protein [Ramlibacter sp.]
MSFSRSSAAWRNKPMRNDDIDSTPAALAQWLKHEHAARSRFVSFADRAGIAALASAYEVQRHYVGLHLLERKSRVAGYKIGLTSAAMQAMCAIESPVAGVVLEDRVHASGVRVRRSDYARLGVEFEIAVLLGHDLPGGAAPCTLDDVAAAVAGVAPAIEIVDDRNCDYAKLDVLSLVADNAWNAGIVLGEFRAAWPDLAQVEGAVAVNGAEPSWRGCGKDVLGHPFAAVAWLADHLAGAGQSLRKGDVVMTGSMVTTQFPTGSQRLRFDVSGLGAVEIVVDE